MDLIKYADTAMYNAKENVHFYDTNMTIAAYEKIVLESRLRSVIENEEFKVYFQSQIDTATKRIVGVGHLYDG